MPPDLQPKLQPHVAHDGVLRAAVIGVGYLGRIHAQKYQMIANIELVAVVDVHADNARQAGEALKVPYYSDYYKIFDQVDLVTIATPTHSHFQVAAACLKAGLHVLVEKPMTSTLEEADELIALAEQYGLVLQVGHLKRFHPAVVALTQSGILKNPKFIDSTRLSHFKGRSLDLDVVLDLMIHDVDLILNFVRSEVVDVDAVGMKVVTDQVDIANARLRFQNGCVANVTASRIARDARRRMRIFQENSFISLDFTQNDILIVERGEGAIVTKEGEHPVVEGTTLPIENYDTLEAEITAFCDAVRYGHPPLVSGWDGRKALHVVTMICKAIERLDCHAP